MAAPNTTFPVYITKHWQSRGIETAQAVCSSYNPNLVALVRPDGRLSQDLYFRGTNRYEWHRTLEEAQAEVRRAITRTKGTLAKRLKDLEDETRYLRDTSFYLEAAFEPEDI